MDVAVLGATERGRAIVGQCAAAGHAVNLSDEDANLVVDAIDDVERRLGPSAADLVDGTTGLEAAAGEASLVVDATSGDAQTRRELAADVEAIAEDEALLAVGGRSHSVTAVAAGLRRPRRAVGLHFVRTDDPSVVEVVVAEQTTAESLARAREFVEGLGATPLVVRDAPGFASARLDLALLVEAIRLIEEGVASVEDVDLALELGRDHPTGPLALADEMGLDDVFEALEDLANRLDGRFDPPSLLREKVEDGALGKRTGEGFYTWEDGERVGPADASPTIEAESSVGDEPRRR